MASMEEAFERACNNRVIPGAVVIAENRDGSFHYSNVFGSSLSPRGAGPDTPLTMDSVFAIASCTKLMTSIAAMQCVERGLVKLDDDVASILPELASLELLLRFDDKGRAVTRPRKNTVTLRHLLTHTSGLSYDFLSPKLRKYRQSKDEPLGGAGRTLLDRFGLPLLFEPGTSWGYSASIDFAGRLVERVTGKNLEQYMKENIWMPLGIKDITFWPTTHPGMQARMSTMSMRDPGGSGTVVLQEGPLFNDKSVDCLGGGGCYATMPDYIKVLKSLLVDDEKLLKKDTAEAMFSPQLPEHAADFLDSLRDRPAVWSMFVGNFPRHVRLDWGLGGVLTTETDSGWRGKHTMLWSGLPNLFWFIDRENGLCGIYGGQVMPPGDAKTNEMITLFEKTMYERCSKLQSKL